MALNPSGDDNLAGNTFIDSDGDVHLNGTTVTGGAKSFKFLAIDLT